MRDEKSAGLKFYYGKNTVSVAVHITLEELGVTYSSVLVDITKADHKEPAYLTINPKGRVPALETEQGILTEAPSILAYLVQTYPEAKLGPTDPYHFARMQTFNMYLASTVHVNHAHRHRGHRWADDETARAFMTAKVPENMTECARMIEEHYLEGPWVLGDQYSVCDAYLFTIARWLPADKVRVEDYPLIELHRLRMLERPAVQQALSYHE